MIRNPPLWGGCNGRGPLSGMSWCIEKGTHRGSNPGRGVRSQMLYSTELSEQIFAGVHSSMHRTRNTIMSPNAILIPRGHSGSQPRSHVRCT